MGNLPAHGAAGPLVAAEGGEFLVVEAERQVGFPVASLPEHGLHLDQFIVLIPQMRGGLVHRPVADATVRLPGFHKRRKSDQRPLEPSALHGGTNVVYSARWC